MVVGLKSQGDEERRLGMPISHLMDREANSVPKLQATFIEFVVLPTIQVYISLQMRT